MPYGATEPGYGFLQIPGMPKNTGASTGGSPGDTFAFDQANNQWKRAVAGQAGPFGFVGNLDVISETLDVLTNTYTIVRGVTDTASTMSVIVSGRITKKAEASVVAGDLVKVSATNPLTHVQKWVTGTDAANLVVGRYVINETQYHRADVAAPTTSANDLIKIDIRASYP
jgi:hypothetical protein